MDAYNLKMLLTFAMAGLAMFFWMLELKAFLNQVEKLKKNTPESAMGTVQLTFGLLFALPLLLPLIIDIYVTTWLSNGFNFGTMGGLIGLFMSNILSIFIVFTTRRLSR